MDVLVQWSDGSRNVVDAQLLKYKPPLEKNKIVKMRWGKLWWRGKTVDFECAESKYELHTMIQAAPKRILIVYHSYQ